MAQLVLVLASKQINVTYSPRVLRVYIAAGIQFTLVQAFNASKNVAMLDPRQAMLDLKFIQNWFDVIKRWHSLKVE